MKKLTIKDWVIVTRPWSFSATALPTLVALLFTLYANPYGENNWLFGVLAIIGAVIFHAAGNVISDYNDFKHGIDRNGNVVGTDMLTSGLFTLKQFLVLGWTLLIVGVLLGLFLVWQTSLTLLWIGLFGTIATLFYFRFKVSALGDLLIFLVYGPVIMMGTWYVVSGTLDFYLLLLSISLVPITVSILHGNNTRDMENDRAANIRTFAMMLGVCGSKIYYYLLTGLAYAAIVTMVILGKLPLFALITLLTLPIAIKNCKAMSQVSEDDKSSVTMIDQETAKLQLTFSLALTVALVVAIVLG